MINDDKLICCGGYLNLGGLGGLKYSEIYDFKTEKWTECEYYDINKDKWIILPNSNQKLEEIQQFGWKMVIIYM